LHEKAATSLPARGAGMMLPNCLLWIAVANLRRLIIGNPAGRELNTAPRGLKARRVRARSVL